MNPLDALYFLAAILGAPLWSRKARGDWPGRFGRTPPLPGATEGRPRVLLHAVSVGEVNTLRALVPLLTPTVEVVISVGTDTGISRARELFESVSQPQDARCRVVRYPLDFSRSVHRFLNAVRPDAVTLVELELWPNFIRECNRRSIPAAVINGRLSARSFRGYRRLRPFLRSTFASLRFAAVQDEAYAARFREMGVPTDRCIVTGSMKWDSASPTDSVPGADALAAELGIDRARPLIVAGSTAPLPRGSGFSCEEGLLHNAVRSLGSEVQLLCAPRRPEHFDAAAAALPGCTRRSAKTPAPPGTTRFLLDTIGDLRTAYSLADVVVVGRSFGDLHGSDPIEPVALGKPTLIGPRYSDFESIVAAMEGCGALGVVSADELAVRLRYLLQDAAARGEMGARGRECIQRNQGATKKHAALILNVARDAIRARA